MPRPAKQKYITCVYFNWIVYKRPTGTWNADGRGNGCGLKRYSLGTTDQSKAIEVLKVLDAKMAVATGKAPAAILNTASLLPIEKGIELYISHVKRPAVAGGARPGTPKRYHAVFEKFTKFVGTQHIAHWQQVTKDVLMAYGQWLDDSDYAYDTVYLELSTINQLIKYLALGKKILPADSYQPLGLSKSDEINRYCYTSEQVEAMINLCLINPELLWLAYVVVGLATTGLRIGELACLRWSDIDIARNLIVLPDNSRRGTRKQRANARTTKGGYTRSFPINPDLLVVLEKLPRHPDGRVFHGPRGGHLKPDTARLTLISDVITPLKEKFPDLPDELNFSSGRLHSFRHFFVSAAADAGIPEQMLMAWLGHKSSRMIRHYYHLRQKASQEQMTKLNLVGSAAALLRQISPRIPETPKSDGSIN